MGTSERAVDRGGRLGERTVAELGHEIHAARLARGWSQADVGRAVGLSGTRVSLIERGRVPRVPFMHLVRILAVFGLELSARAYPVGQPLRDEAHLALLATLRSRIPAGMSWRTEVPLPLAGDGRAWDAVIGVGQVGIGVEAKPDCAMCRPWKDGSASRSAMVASNGCSCCCATPAGTAP